MAAKKAAKQATTKPGKSKPAGRGGKREGAGRKAKHAAKPHITTISLPPEAYPIWDRLRGQLSRSEWVLKALLLADMQPP